MKLLTLYSDRKAAGFSLPEVAVAIGIISFSLVSLVGLLPVGLSTMKVAQEQAAAASCLTQIATSIRRATLSSGQYQAQSPFAELSWSTPNNVANISLSGAPTPNQLDQRLAAHVEFKTQPTATTPGEALISVAWPNRATWNADAQKWVNARGSVSTWLIFSPEQ